MCAAGRLKRVHGGAALPSGETNIGYENRRILNAQAKERIAARIARDMLRHFKVDIAVIGTSALDEDGDLLDFNVREVRISQAIIKQARQAWLAADCSKFTRSAPVRIASLADLDRFITDAPPPDRIARLCAEWQTQVTICDDGRI
jgi:DeoR family glycerol-3-phosphate regulon repressor